jgi:hypothetical protein
VYVDTAASDQSHIAGGFAVKKQAVNFIALSKGMRISGDFVSDDGLWFHALHGDKKGPHPFGWRPLD